MAISTSTELSDLPAFMTEAEVAAYLRVPTAGLRRWRYDKKGPRVRKICGQARYAREDVMAWLDSQ